MTQRPSENQTPEQLQDAAQRSTEANIADEGAAYANALANQAGTEDEDADTPGTMADRRQG
jgi:hypothetical protein